MTPDDVRHGTSAGYCAGCHDVCCRTAIADYSRDLRTRQYLAGGPLVIDALGTKRRVRALMALGWTGRQIDAELVRKPTYTVNLLCGPDKVNRATASRVAAAYERLSMRLPDDEPDANRQVISRTRGAARRKGWSPPLAWDDDTIDDPDATPAAAYRPPGVVRNPETRIFEWPDEPVDDVAVQRVLDGDWRLACTKADKVAVVARWTGTYGELERLTGWKVERYVTAEDAA